jgi:hypothetical protein
MTRTLDRTAWAALLGTSAFVLAASVWLTPAESGVGTHTQLGLPPCGFLVLFGKPCPACGLTTAFAHLAHLQPLASLRAHPVGLPLFAINLGVLALSAHGLATGRAVTHVVDRLSADRVALGVGGALLATWAVRLVF